jgi:hypothetical protein
MATGIQVTAQEMVTVMKALDKALNDAFKLWDAVDQLGGITGTISQDYYSQFSVGDEGKNANGELPILAEPVFSNGLGTISALREVFKDGGNPSCAEGHLTNIRKVVTQISKKNL